MLMESARVAGRGRCGHREAREHEGGVPGMSGPAPRSISVSAQQRRVLEGILRRETSTQQLARRARTILLAVGSNNVPVARRVGVSDETVRAWRQRWAEAGAALLAAEAEGGDGALEMVVRGILADEPQSGAPAIFTPEQVCAIVAVACEPPAASERPIGHWTPRELADEAVKRGIVAAMSPQSVHRFFKGGRSQAVSEPLLAHASAR